MAKKRVKKKSTNISHLVESETYEDIEVVDPNTGKRTTQRVKVTRYKPKTIKPLSEAEDLDEVINKINDSVNCTPIIDIDA